MFIQSKLITSIELSLNNMIAIPLNLKTTTTIFNTNIKMVFLLFFLIKKFR